MNLSTMTVQDLQNLTAGQWTLIFAGFAILLYVAWFFHELMTDYANKNRRPLKKLVTESLLDTVFSMSWGLVLVLLATGGRILTNS